jgi:ABC-type branched-chain amino acid transport system, permease component
MDDSRHPDSGVAAVDSFFGISYHALPSLCSTLQPSDIHGISLAVMHDSFHSAACFFLVPGHTPLLSCTMNFGINPWIGLIAGILMGALVGAFVGFLNFRFGLRGSYFSLITLAFAEAFRIIANTVKFAGAGMGIYIPLDQHPLNFQFEGRTGFYYVILALFLIATAITLKLENS